MPMIQTVLGPVPVERLGLILPHEHLFTDLRGADTPGLGEADLDDVQAAMQRHLDAAWAAGITALVECTPAGVGRNPLALKRLAQHTPVAIVAAAGLYRQEFLPRWALAASEAEVEARMLAELNEGIDGSGVRAGFIKLAVSNEGITELEKRDLRAAARAAAQTGAVVASHTSGLLSGAHALEEVEILESAGLPGSRFIWVHTQNSPHLAEHRAVAARGAYLGFDGLSPEREEAFLKLVLDALGAGLGRQILLSHDAGWYRPGEPGGGKVRGYTYLVERFLPRLRERGVDEATIRLMTDENPKRAFGKTR
ncbi:MAG: esterase [Chloroflexi bacterium]|nr:esterase [Chloroflexota bacterium]